MNSALTTIRSQEEVALSSEVVSLTEFKQGRTLDT